MHRKRGKEKGGEGTWLWISRKKGGCSGGKEMKTEGRIFFLKIKERKGGVREKTSRSSREKGDGGKEKD